MVLRLGTAGPGAEAGMKIDRVTELPSLQLKNRPQSGLPGLPDLQARVPQPDLLFNDFD